MQGKSPVRKRSLPGTHGEQLWTMKPVCTSLLLIPSLASAFVFQQGVDKLLENKPGRLHTSREKSKAFINVILSLSLSLSVSVSVSVSLSLCLSVSVSLCLSLSLSVTRVVDWAQSTK